MEKIMLLSCVLAWMLIPMQCAASERAQRGWKKTVLLILSYQTIYLFLIMYIYPRISR